MENRIKNFIDKLFKSKLDSDQFAPDDLLWKEIENQLPEKKQRRRWLFLLLFGFIAAGAGVFFLAQEKNASQLSNQSQQVTEQKLPAKQEPFASSSNSGKGETPGNTDMTDVGIQNRIDTSSNEDQNKKSALIASSNNIQSNPEIKNGNLSDHNSGSAVAPEEKVSVPKSSALNEKLPTNKNEPNSEVKTDEVTTAEKDLAESDQTDAHLNTDSISATDLKSDFDSKNQVSKKDSSIKAQPDKEVAKKTDSTLKEQNKPAEQPSNEGSNKNMRWFIDVFLNFRNNSRNISASGDPDPLYLSRRDNEEKVLSTFNYGFHVGLEKGRLQLLTGLGLNHYTEDIQYENRANCYFVKNTGGYINADSVWIYTYDSTIAEVQNDSISLHNGKQTSSYLEVPVHLSYKIPVGHFSIHAGAGVSAMFNMQWNAWYLNKTITGLENPSSKEMLRPLVLNAAFNLGLEIPATKHLSILFDLNYQQNLNSIFKKEYFLDQKYKGIGGELSLRYFLGK